MKSSLRCSLVLLGLLVGPTLARAQAYAPPHFTDADRAKKISALIPEITKLYTDYAAEKHAPGLVWGIVLDGQREQRLLALRRRVLRRRFRRREDGRRAPGERRRRISRARRALCQKPGPSLT